MKFYSLRRRLPIHSRFYSDFLFVPVEVITATQLSVPVKDEGGGGAVGCAPRPGNKIYGTAVFVADLLLIVSQLSKNPILLNEAAIGFVYWTGSRNLFTEQSGQVSSFSLFLRNRE